MSRTYRDGVSWLYKLHGHYYEFPPASALRQHWEDWRGVHLARVENSQCRDGKFRNGLMTSASAPWFKVIRRRERRRAENQAVYLGKELPIFKKSDRYNWW